MKIKIALGVLVGIIGVLIFFVFFYPDEKLQDLSDLTPSIQNVTKENNAYYLIEEARKNYQKTQYSETDILFYFIEDFRGYTHSSGGPNDVTADDIDKFLALEESSMKLLEQAEQLPYYKNPKEDSYQTLTFTETIPSDPYASDLVNMLFIKGLNEFKQGKSDIAIQTIIQAAELAVKIRRGVISVLDYLINNTTVEQGKTILDNFAKKGAVIPSEIEARIAGLKDNDWKDYINALKFEFQVEKNGLNDVTKEGNEFTKIHFGQNHFNFRKNATTNSLAANIRNLISETKDFNCAKTSEDFKGISGAPWKYLLKENGIGQIYISSVKIENSSRIFCDNSAQTTEQSQKIDTDIVKKIKRN